MGAGVTDRRIRSGGGGDSANGMDTELIMT